jgi:SAM-dependent methyltransferase
MSNKEWTPQELLRTSGAYWASAAIHAGVALGVFSALRDAPASAGDIAAAVRGDARGVAVLLDALTALGLAAKAQGRYAATAFSERYLREGSPDYLGHMIRHHHHLMESWARLHEAVAAGHPVRSRSSHAGGDVREAFLMGMHNSAMLLAPQVAREVDLRGRRRLLDLGGGPGTYAANFCLANPGLAATVFDLPDTARIASLIAARYGLEGRVAFAGGDFLEDDLGGPYDVVWLSHILHGEGPEECRRIIRKAAAALEPGGVFLVHEFILDDAKDGPVYPALFSLNMLLGTPSGRSYAEYELREMLEEAGIAGIRRLPMPPQAPSGVLRGEKLRAAG